MNDTLHQNRFFGVQKQKKTAQHIKQNDMVASWL
jgi:hypothetical protein